MADDLRVDIELLADGDNLVGNLRTDVNLHAVSHVEHLVHLFPVGTRAVVDNLEQWRDGEHVVFHHTAIVVNEMQDFSLRSACAMNHSVNLRTHVVNEFPNHGGIGACWGKHELSGVHVKAVYLVG